MTPERTLLLLLARSVTMGPNEAAEVAKLVAEIEAEDKPAFAAPTPAEEGA